MRGRASVGECGRVHSTGPPSLRSVYFDGRPRGVLVEYGDAAGAFYGMTTLVQILENTVSAIPYLTIEDEPTFPTRGYMPDIGRNKVPLREEICAPADWLASMKVNHLELYFEGVPFEYPSFFLLISGLHAHHLADETKPEDYDRVSAYLTEIGTRMAAVDLRCDRSGLILEEYRVALVPVGLMQSVGKYHHAVRAEDTAAQKALPETVISEMPAIIGEIRRTWLLRNRYSYLDESLLPLTTMLEQAKEARKAL